MGGCQRQGMGEMGGGGQKAHISSYKVNRGDVHTAWQLLFIIPYYIFESC